MAKKYGIKAVKGFEIKGLSELFKKLDNMPQVIEAACIDGVTEVAEDIQARAKLKAMANNNKVASAIEVQSATVSDSIISASVFVNTMPYGATPVPTFVEMGTGPVGAASAGDTGTKYPLSSSSYRSTGWTYYNESGRGMKDGQPGFVHTMGQPAHPFLYPSALEVKPFATGIIKDALERQIKKLAKGG